MADKIEKIIADTFLQMAEGLETGSFGKKPRIALTGMGSEHGEENAMEAAKMAVKDGKLMITTDYPGDITLEAVSFEQKAAFFEEIFGIRPVLRHKKYS